MTRPEELPELWEQQASEYPASEYVAAGAVRGCARELREALADPVRLAMEELTNQNLRWLIFQCPTTALGKFASALLARRGA